jgi:hypothetical protein
MKALQKQVGTTENNLAYIIQAMSCELRRSWWPIHDAQADDIKAAQFVEHGDAEWMAVLSEINRPISWCEGVPLRVTVLAIVDAVFSE